MKLSKKPGCALALSLLFATVVSVKAQDTWSLQRSVDYALANNIDIKKQDVQKRFAALTFRQSKLSQIPSVSLGFDGTYSSGRNIDPSTNTYITQNYFSTTGGLSAGATIFNWFSQRNVIASNKYQAEAESRLLEKARNDVAFNIASAFFQILLNNEQVHVSELQVKLTTSQLENTKKLVLAGSSPESDQADLEAKLASDSVTLIDAQNQVILSTLQMKALLNLGFEVPYVPEIPEKIADIPLPRLDEVDPEMVYSAAMSTNPLIKADELLIKSMERTYASTKGQLYPKLTASFNLSSNYSNSFKYVPAGSTGEKTIPFGDQVNNNRYQAIGVSLSIPILNGWQARTNVQKAKLNITTQELTRDQDNQTLRQDIYTAHANAVAAIQKFSAASKGVEASQRAYNFATKRFDLGLMNTIDYITTQNNLFKAQIDKISAQYDYIFKMKLLEFYRDQKITL